MFRAPDRQGGGGHGSSTFFEIIFLPLMVSRKFGCVSLSKTFKYCWSFYFHNLVGGPDVSRIFVKSFLILSVRGPLVYPKQGNPSSRYKPILCFPYFSPRMWRIYEPTSSHNSAPSKLPIVKGKSGSPFFFIHVSVLLNSRNFLEYIMVLITFIY